MPCQPAGPVEILAGTPEGGGQDRAARALAIALTVSSDLECWVSNIPGRGGGNAWDELAVRPPEQNVVSIASATIVTNRLLGIAGLDHRGLTPLALLCTEALAFVVPVSSNITDTDRLLAKLSGGGGVTAIATERGNINHIALARVSAHAGGPSDGGQITVFTSARDAVADALSRGSDLAVVSAASVLPELESGHARVVAVTSASRLSDPFSTVPTWAELGVDCTMGTWRGLVGPPGMAPSQIECWNGWVDSAVRSSSWQDSLCRHRWTSTHLDSAATSTFLDEEEAALRLDLDQLGVLDG